MLSISFNIPFDNERHFRHAFPQDQAVKGILRGSYAGAVEQWFRDQYDSAGVALTASCTNALELAALLLDLQPGDEIIMPSYTFVSTANAFVLRGARPVFCDSSADSPNPNLEHLESLISPRTRALVIVHYAGACLDMDRLRALADRHRLPLIEDAAHAIDARYRGRLLGTFGDFATFSFHETKNITCGQGGALLINNPAYLERARTLSDCGTNRHQFQLGKVSCYSWVDIGSVYNLSELNCAYLLPQLQQLHLITEKRRLLWNAYRRALEPLAARGLLTLPPTDPRCEHNAHLFWITLRSKKERDHLLSRLREQGIQASFHYDGLHRSPWYTRHYGAVSLPHAERYGDCLLRLPLYYDLTLEEVAYCTDKIVREFGE
ncbi:MAG: dTDP-4-amino-4,6-dideoxygalactose transaminase [Lewinellaceae bacterium]|nr:dTDP-4-amino-4,6-dideoxygalactose transaminase [Lewinellaceae bacterium]